MDKIDKKLLAVLQSSADIGNAAIGAIIGLSASQVSRRRQKLEHSGVILGYQAILDPASLGLTLNAIIRVKLSMHSERGANEFRDFVHQLGAVRFACSITGDADYLMLVRLTNLDALSTLINRQLLAHKLVSEVRSEVVLDTIKDNSEPPATSL